MHDLIVVGFHNQYRATEVLDELWRMNDDWLVDLDDAVVVYRDRHGNLRYQQGVAPTVGKGAARRIMGILVLRTDCRALYRREVRPPWSGALAGGSLGGAGGGLSAAWWKDHFGISDEFVRNVSSMIGPDDSSIFAWIQSEDPETLAQRFRGLGGKVLRTTLTPEQSAKLEAVLHSPV